MPTTQPLLSPVERDYLSAFGVSAVCVCPRGKVFVSENPRDASLVFWCKSTDAKRVADLAQRNGDIVGAALRLQVQLTEHVKLIARVRERTGRIEAALQTALDEGTLRAFNQEFRRRRLEAQRAGREFMSYQIAHARLRRVVTEMVSRGGLITQSLMLPCSTKLGPVLGALDYPT